MATIAEGADHVDLSSRHFQTLIDSGVIMRASRGNYDLKIVTHAYIRHLRQVKQGIEGGGSSKLSDARTRVATAKAETAERQNALDAGEWVRVETMISYYAAEMLRIREHFLSMPGKLCGPLAGADSIDAYRIVHDKFGKASMLTPMARAPWNSYSMPSRALAARSPILKPKLC
jgi:hypothetical protein